MDYFLALLPYINIGFFGALIARLTGANLSAIALCCVLYLGATPTQAVAIMLTFLVFWLLSRYTQSHRLRLTDLAIFHGWRLLIPLLFIVIILAINPLYAMAAFIGFFLMEVLLMLYRSLPVATRPTKKEWITSTVIGSGLALLGLAVLCMMPAPVYYLIASLVILVTCALAYFLGKDRRKWTKSWNALLYGAYFLLGLFGLEYSDWLSDVRRPTPTRLATYLPLVTIPVTFIAFVTAHILFGTISFGGLVMALAATVAIRLFGFYEVSGKGPFNVVALAITILAVLCLALVQPVPHGVVDLLTLDTPSIF